MEPTPEQFTEWLQEAIKDGVAGKIGLVCETMAKLAYAAGADAELEVCCEWLSGCGCPSYGKELRAARRPKPPSLKQRALKAFYSRHSEPQYYRDVDGNEALISPDLYADMALIEQALQALPDD
jgi:hypothetical protein